MKKHKIIFAACVALFASICFLGCETEEEFTQISEFKPGAGTYSFEFTIEQSAGVESLPEGVSSRTRSDQASGTCVIEGTDDNSKVTQTYSSMISSLITKFSSEDSYNSGKSLSSSSSESSATVEYSFDDVNYTITAKASASESSLESLSENLTYSDFISSVNDSSSKVEIYFSNRGSYKLIIVDDSYKQTAILTLQ